MYGCQEKVNAFDKLKGNWTVIFSLYYYQIIGIFKTDVWHFPYKRGNIDGLMLRLILGHLVSSMRETGRN